MTLLVLFLLLLCSGLISASETAVFSLQPADRRRLLARGGPSAALLRSPTSLLVALLIANLAINVAYFTVGARMSIELARTGNQVASGALAAGSVLALVLMGEILPKSLALAAPMRLVLVVSPMLVGLRLVLTPLVALGEGVTRLVEAPLLQGRPAPRSMHVDDFKSAVARRSASGTYHAVEMALLHDVIDFGVRRARNLMTPRVDVVFLDIQDSREEWIEQMAARPHTDYPVCDGEPDRLLGTVSTVRVLSRPDTARRELIEPALLAPETIGAERLVERMRLGESRLAILLDEYGGVEGVVGLSSLSQAVLGEIQTVTDATRSAIVRRGRDSLLVRGNCPVHILLEETGVDIQTRRADTVAGAVVEALGHVPRAGDEVLLENWRLRVATVRGRRVAQVLIRPRGTEAAE
jgi:putative hemolysin